MQYSSVTRLKFLLSLASTGALSACPFKIDKSYLPPASPSSPAASSGAIFAVSPVTSAAPAAPNLAPPAGPVGAANTLNITNSTSYSNSAIKVYVVGINPQNGAWSSLQASGSVAALSASPAPGLPLNAQTTTFPLPYLGSARIYFAVNGTLNIQGSGGAATQPAGWVQSDPSYQTLFDWIEYDYAAGAGLYCNTTQVDMFGLPITIQIGVNGAPSGSMLGMGPGARSSIFSAIRALGAPFSNLIVSNNGTDLRVIYPGFAIASGLFPSTYLDSYIQSVWTYYQKNTMTLNTTAYSTWSGTVSGAAFTFTQNGQTVTIAQPSTSDTLQCAGPLASGTSAAGSRIEALIAAGLNRGSLLTGTSQPDINPSDFYQTAPIHQYAKIMHQYGLQNRSYAFAYDDEGGFDATIAYTGAGPSLNVVLSAF